MLEQMLIALLGEFPFDELQKVQQRKKVILFQNYRVASPCRFEELQRRIELLLRLLFQLVQSLFNFPV